MEKEEKAKILLKYEETKKEFERSKKELEAIGKAFQELGSKLAVEPEKVLFDRQEYHMTTWGELPLVATGFENWFNIEALKKATTKHRSLAERLEDLENKKREMGFS